MKQKTYFPWNVKEPSCCERFAWLLHVIYSWIEIKPGMIGYFQVPAKTTFCNFTNMSTPACHCWYSQSQNIHTRYKIGWGCLYHLSCLLSWFTFAFFSGEADRLPKYWAMASHHFYYLRLHVGPILMF